MQEFMADFFEKLCNTQLTNFLFTIVLVGILLLLRHLTLRYVTRKQWDSETSLLRAHSYVKAAFSTIIFIAIIFIWIPQIQAFAFSVAAIAVAIAVSLKELITLLTGSLARTSLDFISIGDRIEVNGIKGDVVKTGFLATSFVEVGDCNQRTGKIVSIPNNIFFTHPVIKHQAFGDFSIHTITVPIKANIYSSKALEALLKFIQTEADVYKDAFTKKFKAVSKTDVFLGVDAEPRVLVSVREADEFDIVIRMPIPIKEKVRIEQKLISKILELFPPQ